MNDMRLHTPEGFRDIYGETREVKDDLMERLRKVLRSRSYRPLTTPAVEYFDVFASDIGTTPSNELFKFFDREGNTLVLRPDFTPSVARAVSMHLMPADEALKIRYEGNTYTNSHDLRLIVKEQTQMGIEIIGDGSEYADAEVIDICCEMLKAAGLTDFQVSIGENNYFKALAAISGLTDDILEEIRGLILMKNFFGVGELLKAHNIKSEIRDAFTRLPQLFGGSDVLAEAEKYAVNDGADESVKRLKRIGERLKMSGNDRYVSYDFGLLGRYHYYTGMIMSAFTYGQGESVAKGGRYDNLLKEFGRDAPAVGMAVNIDHLMNAIARNSKRN